MENKSLNLKPTIRTQFFLGAISNEVSASESREPSFNGNMYDFSVD